MKFRAKLKSDGTILVENVVTSSRVGLDMGGFPIYSLGTPISGTDAVTLNFVNLLSSSYSNTDLQLSASLSVLSQSFMQLSSSFTSLLTFDTVNDFNISSQPADGTYFQIKTPPGEFRYITGSGTNWAADNKTILKLNSVATSSNGRAFSTRDGATVATFAALRNLKSGIQNHIHVQSYSSFNDGGGGIFDVVPSGSYVDDGGTVAIAENYAFVRRDRNTSNIFVNWFGAKINDSSAATANTTAINAAINCLDEGGTLSFISGIYYVDNTISFKNKRFFTVQGNGAIILGLDTANWTNKVICDMGGVSYAHVHNLRVYTPTDATFPAMAAMTSYRTNVSNGGGNQFYGCYFYGQSTIGTVILSCCENTQFLGTTFEGDGCSALIDCSDDPTGLANIGYFISNYSRKYQRCNFGTLGGSSTGSIVKLQGRSYDIDIENCFFHSTMALTGVRLCHSITPDYVNDLGQSINISQIRTEMPTNFTAVAIEKPINNSKFEFFNVSSTGNFVKTLLPSGSFAYSKFYFPFKGGSTAPQIVIDGGSGKTCSFNDITVNGTDDITVSSAALTVSKINAMTAYPFAGAGWSDSADYANDITVRRYSGGSTNFRTGMAEYRAQRTLTGDSGNVGGLTLFYLTPGGATNITNFINGVNGQEITIKTTNALSTFVEGATMHLLDGVNFTAPANSILKFVLDGTVWRQVNIQEPASKTYALNKSGDTMSGSLNMGGYNLTNFVTTSSLGMTLASGSGLTEVLRYAPALSNEQMLTLGIRIIAWETVLKTTSGVAETEVTCQLSGTILNIKGTPVWDKTSKGFPSTFDCALAISSSAGVSSLVILAKPGANAGKCSVYIWHQLPITLS